MTSRFGSKNYFWCQVKVIFDFFVKNNPQMASFTHSISLVLKFLILDQFCLLGPSDVTIWVKKLLLMKSQCHFWLFRPKISPDYKFHVFNKFSSQVPDFGPILPFGPKWRHDLGQKITFDVKSRSFLIFSSKIIPRWQVSRIQ